MIMRPKDAAWYEGDRIYTRHSPHTQSFVFGSARFCMWAWVVYWGDGSASGVERVFRTAVKRADESIRQVEARWPQSANAEKKRATKDHPKERQRKQNRR